MLTIAYIPCGSKEEAEKIGEALVKEKLAACTNIIESRSICEWKGKLEKTGEWIILAKTQTDRFKELEARVRELHSYELPAIIQLKADANQDYLDWVREETK